MGRLGEDYGGGGARHGVSCPHFARAVGCFMDGDRHFAYVFADETALCPMISGGRGMSGCPGNGEYL